MFINREYNW